MNELVINDKKEGAQPSPDPQVKGIGYVGFWRRLGAAIPDLIIAGIVAFFANIVLEQWKFPYPVLGTLFIAGAFFLLLYSPLCISSRYRATTGKILFGIIVVYGNGRQLPFSRALIRELGKYVSLITLGIGFVIIGFTKNKQGLNDLIADTIVIDISVGLIYQRTNVSDPATVRKRLRTAAIIICICIACSVIPLIYFGTMSSKNISTHSIAAYGLASAADTISDSKYPEYSLDVYDTAIALHPDNMEIQMKRLNVLGSIGRGDEARAYLDQIVVMYPNETTPMIYRGDLLIQEGKYQDAVACYEKAISADPKNARIWVKKGDAYLIMAITEMTEIRDIYKNLTANSKKPGSAYGAVPFDAFQSSQLYQEAVKSYNKAIELDPMTSIAISGRILSSTQNLVETYEGILKDMNHQA
ncbi:MAG: tetratricopeptide repeat protein [Methanoregula sp.]|nr:tetratricopeptide repeat protein [Methanoregula sp.]